MGVALAPGHRTASRGDLAVLRDAFEAFAAGDPGEIDALLSPAFLHVGNPLFHRDDEPRDFATMTERVRSLEEHGMQASSRLIEIERVSDTAFVATTVLHTENAAGEGISMLAGVVVTVDDLDRIDHLHTYDTPAAARRAAATGCCAAHRERAYLAAQATP